MIPAQNRLRVAVLLSGNGSTLQNLFDQIDAGSLPIEIGLVLSSREDAYGLERARRRNVPCAFVKRRKDPTAFSDAIYAALQSYAPQLIVLAGFMSYLEVREPFRNRILNTHPSLLPAFGGRGFFGHHVHAAVLARGCKITGCTVHFVDHEYDHGPILAQSAVDVLQDDTVDALAQRVQAAERLLLPEALRWIAAGRVRVEGQRVRLI